MAADLKLLSNAASLPTPEARVAYLRHNAARPAMVEIRTVAQALEWGDEWRSLALRWQALADRENTLRQIAEIHEKASELLLEFAYAEIEQLKGLL